MSSLVYPGVLSAQNIIAPPAGVARGFSARKATASGSAGSVIGGWSEDWDSEGAFNPTTGVWTPGSGADVIWIGAGGFSVGGTPGNTAQVLTLRKAAAAQVLGYDFHNNAGHADSCFVGYLATNPGSQAHDVVQDGDTFENCWFSGFAISTAVAFCGRTNTPTRNTGANNRLEGFTEDFDLGADFNPTSGVFTVPTTGLYLFSYAARPSVNQNSALHLGIRVNGTLNYGTQLNDLGTGFSNSLGMAVLLNLSAGATVSIHAEDAQERFNITHFSGVLVTPSTAFAARKVTGSGVTSDVISGWTEDFDGDSVFNASTGVFTAPATGQYLVMAAGRIERSTAGETQIRLNVNGSEYVRSRMFNGSFAIDGHCRLGIVVSLTAGDTLSLTQISGAADECFFAVMSIDLE